MVGSSGTNLCLCDGSVRFVSNGIAFANYQAATTRDGGEVVTLN